jgi:hypothetical protein
MTMDRRGDGMRTLIIPPIAALIFPFTVFADSPLPLGDGKLASQPTAGFVYRCGSGMGNGPRMAPGPWIRGQYWYPDQKPAVQGRVTWPNARISIELSGNERVISTNTLPNHITGIFPIQPSDPVYRYDRNPNQIRERQTLLRIPAQPNEASAAHCLTPGPIGYLLSGVALFDALDATSQDAPAHEVQDACNGHPQQQGQYHYHNYSNCLQDDAGKRGQHSDLVGYAADGFGIYGTKGENGNELTNDHLDACHGHVHTITWDGKPARLYHYHFTRMFPYSIGCFKGKPIRMESPGRGERPEGPPPQGSRPPRDRPRPPR